VRLATKLLFRRADLIAFIERNQRNGEVTNEPKEKSRPGKDRL
jgi:hypothetical protein